MASLQDTPPEHPDETQKEPPPPGRAGTAETIDATPGNNPDTAPRYCGENASAPINRVAAHPATCRRRVKARNNRSGKPPVPLTRTLPACPFCQPPQQNRLSRTSPPPQLQTPHPARHGKYPLHAPPHAENTHGEHSWRLACLLLFARGHGGEVIDVLPTTPKTNSIPQPPPFLLSAVAVNSFHKPRFAKPRDKVYYGNITLAFM